MMILWGGEECRMKGVGEGRQGRCGWEWEGEMGKSKGKCMSSMK